MNAPLLGMAAAAAFALTLGAKDFLWLEAESFADRGEWRLDTQFVHKMGSAYLLAGGVGTPVGAARTALDVVRGGHYRAWARTKDWLPEFHPGTFALEVNGTRGATLGASGREGWRWEPAGEFDLRKGRNDLALVDLSGAFARCDALLFTTDFSYVPPDGGEPLRRERARLGGLESEDVAEGGSADILVVGAGPGGFPAALAAARHGAKVLVVHDRPVLGGNASRELGVQTNGAGNGHPHFRDGGIVEEANLRAVALGDGRVLSRAFAAMAAEEANLTVVTNARVISAETDAKTGAITAVVARDTLTGAWTRYRARTFVDGTGDGWLGYFAGAKYRRGREARGEFGEPMAPEAADDLLMSGTLMDGWAAYRAVPGPKPVAYSTPKWADILPPGYWRNVTSPKPSWWMEHGSEFDELEDPERARDELIRISFAYWGWIKNGWKDRAQAANWTLESVPHMNGRREGLRLVGDYVFTANDATSARVFPDRIATGGWDIDVHDPRGATHPGGDGTWRPKLGCSEIYTIPYRILYSVNVPNLFMVGRCVSCTHWGLGTLRVEATCATMGQAAGTAAAEALKLGLSPRDYGRRRIGELQQMLLRDDVYLPGLAVDGRGDLARQATATATSCQAEGVRRRQDVVVDERRAPLAFRKGPFTVVFRRGTTERLEAFHPHLVSSLDHPVDVTLELRESDTTDAPERAVVATAKVHVPARAKGYVGCKVGAKLSKAFAWVSLRPVKGVAWSFCTRESQYGARAWPEDRDEATWRYYTSDQYACFTEPDLTWRTGADPQNVTDGVARSFDGEEHGWISDPAQPLPQALTLTWPRPVTAREVRLTFDSDFRTRWASIPAQARMVKGYALECATGDGPWRPLADERGNVLRHRIHRFAPETFDRLRLTVTETHGDPSARVFEIRVE